GRVGVAVEQVLAEEQHGALDVYRCRAVLAGAGEVVQLRPDELGRHVEQRIAGHLRALGDRRLVEQVNRLRAVGRLIRGARTALQDQFVGSGAVGPSTSYVL